MPRCLPGGIRHDSLSLDFHLKNHACLIVVVPFIILCNRNNGAVTGTPIEGNQHGDGVFAFLEVQRNLVIVAVIGRRAALEGTIQYHHLPIEEQHILVHRRDTGHSRHLSIHRNRFTECHIAVIAAAFGPDPVGRPITLAIVLDCRQVGKIGTIRLSPFRSLLHCLHRRRCFHGCILSAANQGKDTCRSQSHAQNLFCQFVFHAVRLLFILVTE